MSAKNIKEFLKTLIILGCIGLLATHLFFRAKDHLGVEPAEAIKPYSPESEPPDSAFWKGTEFMPD